jgi:RpiB/LacA/LacB family sugar-phosphate isomerase
MKIVIGCDHAALELKNSLKKFLLEAGHTVDDVGTNGTDSVDYPDFAALVARRVVSGEAQRGVLCCGSGIGMAIVFTAPQRRQDRLFWRTPAHGRHGGALAQGVPEYAL